MLHALQSTYDLVTRPATTEEGYRYLPSHGALWPLILIEIAYMIFVFRIGPWLMRNREPFKLPTVLRYYNIIQIAFNGFMATMGFYLYIFRYIVPLGCMTVLPWEHPLKWIEVLAGISYVSNKFVDFFDTIVFVLRKSYKQVTFLHVYHHIMMSSISYIYFGSVGAGGHAAITGAMNSIVHVIMYGYYFVSATRPEMKNSLWWKKYITQVQLLQFVLASIHNLWPLLIDTDCVVPKIFCFFSVIQTIFMIYLFSSFYKKSYLDVKKKVDKSK